MLVFKTSIPSQSGGPLCFTFMGHFLFRYVSEDLQREDFISWPYDQKYTVWKYWDKTDSSYIIPGANDIEVQCKRKGNTYLDSKIVKFLILM